MALAINEPTDLPTYDGIYEPAEAAKYLKAAMNSDVLYPLNSTKLIRWIHRGLGNPELMDIPGASLLIDFQDLISLRVIAALRTAGISWPAIRRAEVWLREMTGVNQPFATEPLWAGQGDLFTEWEALLVSGNRSGQIALDLLRTFLIPVHGLVFDTESSKAVSWEPSHEVVLQPGVQFGAPCVKDTRIPTRTIAGMVVAGDSKEWIARSYKLSLATVLAACEWESRLQSK